MRQKLIDFLKALEIAVPPAPRAHHAITYAQFGSDEAGWQDRLALQVGFNGRFHCFFLDDEDFEKPTGELASSIVELLNNPQPTDQTSTEPLRY